MICFSSDDEILNLICFFSSNTTNPVCFLGICFSNKASLVLSKEWLMVMGKDMVEVQLGRIRKDCQDVLLWRARHKYDKD